VGRLKMVVRKLKAAIYERVLAHSLCDAVTSKPVLAGNHLRRVMRSYALYYNEARTHRSLDKDSPRPRPIQRIGQIAS
jgi:hypothetical protein